MHICMYPTCIAVTNCTIIRIQVDSWSGDHPSEANFMLQDDAAIFKILANMTSL